MIITYFVFRKHHFLSLPLFLMLLIHQSVIMKSASLLLSVTVQAIIGGRKRDSASLLFLKIKSHQGKVCDLIFWYALLV